jgi:DNA-binding beta-propeller fold protein YncE
LTAIRRFVLHVIFVLGVVLGATWLSVSPAAAEVEHPFLSNITECKGETLETPWGMTFDSSGNLFVAEPKPGEIVDEFNPANTCTDQIGASLFPERLRTVAVNNATGTLYVTESSEPEYHIVVLKSEGGGKYTKIQEAFFPKIGFLLVAFDNSAGPHGGDLYVVAGAFQVDVLKPNSEGSSAKAMPKKSLKNRGNARRKRWPSHQEDGPG